MFEIVAMETGGAGGPGRHGVLIQRRALAPGINLVDDLFGAFVGSPARMLHLKILPDANLSNIFATAVDHCSRQNGIGLSRVSCSRRR